MIHAVACLLNAERQIEEKNRQKLKELEQERQADLWADRSMNGPPVVDDYGPDEVTGRTSSAPHPATSLESDHSKHLRGQHIVLDPVTHRELEEKKRKHMEYQVSEAGCSITLGYKRPDQCVVDLGSIPVSEP